METYCVQGRAKMALKHMEGFKVGMAGPEESKWKSEEQKHSAKKEIRELDSGWRFKLSL